MNSFKIRFDPVVTERLAKLRKCVTPAVTQASAAKFFGLKQRQTIGEWEAGVRPAPESRHRSSFQIYLLDRLQLRNDMEQFCSIWNDLMVEQWKWEPLTPDELHNLFGSQAVRYIVAAPKPVLTAPSKPDYDLIGRGSILVELQHRLQDGNTVALYGLPGVGKTALAIQVANNTQLLTYYPDGVLWASLGPNGNVLSQLTKWGADLNILSKDIRDLKNPKCWANAIREKIRSRQYLLVIDDVWDIEWAYNLRLGGQSCSHLITTRFPKIASQFAKNGEVKVCELDISDGIEVLNRLAPNIAKIDSSPLKQLAEAVGGLPLALNLMGNYLRIQSHSLSSTLIEEALVKLNDAKERLRMIDENPDRELHPSLPSDTPLSLAAMIEISYEKLQPSARRMLNVLSILPAKPNTFLGEAVIAIAEEPAEALEELYSFGLVESTGLDRRTVHQTIHQYARTKLTDESVRARACQYFVNYVITHQTDYSLLDADAVNVFTALDMAYNLNLNTHFVSGINAFYRYLETRGYYQQALQLLKHATIAVATLNDRVQLVRVLYHLGKMNLNISDFSTSRTYLGKALEIANKINDVYQISRILQTLGSVDIEEGDYQSAKAKFMKGLALVRSADEQELSHELEADLLRSLGLAYENMGDNEKGEYYYQEGLLLAKKYGLKQSASSILNNLVSMFGSRGYPEKAEFYSVEGLMLAEEIGHRENMCSIYLSLGSTAAYKGDLSKAYNRYVQALAIAEEIGSIKRISTLHMALGAVEYRHGRYDSAEKFLMTALNEATEIGHKEMLCFTLETLGSVAIERDDDYEMAMSRYTQAYQIAEQIQKPERILALLVSLGRTIGRAQGDYVQGEKYLNDALKLAKVLDHALHIASTLKMQGEVYYEQSKLDLAESAFSQALQLAQKEEYTDFVGDSYFGLAKICATQGKIHEAKELGEKAFDAFHSMEHQRVSEVNEWLETLHTDTSS